MWHTSTLPGFGSCDCYLCQPKLPTYLPRPAARAPRENAYYIVAVSGGTVLSKRPDGIFNKDAVNSDTQRWRVEYGDEANRVALMNVSDGKWLRAFSSAAYGHVDTSEEKQWWVIEEGTSPGSCWLKCDDFADAYLCNANGSFIDGNATFTKPKQLDRAHTLTWTLRDADAVGYDAKGWKISILSDEDSASTTLSEREQVLVEKEKALLEMEQNLIAEQQTKHDEFAAREAKLLKISDGLAARETALQKRAEELATRESALNRPQGTSKDIAILRAENDNLHLQLRTSSLEREVEKVRQRSVSLSNVEQLRNLEVEKARLRVLLHAQQQKARNSPSPNKSRDSPSVFSSPSSLATRTVKDSRVATPARNASRPVSSSESALRPPATLSLAATPNSSFRFTNNDSPNTPTRASTGVLSSTSSTQQSYDSRFSGWPEDDDVPATPTRKSKTATPSNLGSPKLAMNTGQARLSKENLLSSNLSNGRAVSSQVKRPGPSSSKSETQSVSITCGKATSKSTPARSQPPRMATLRYGAPDGMLPVRDDGDALVYACGHKVYKPPRKLNKNVVGYLYE
ncbi:hypothetical protein MBLNU13_g10772t2 [Cladosporium sp. NU13]